MTHAVTPSRLPGTASERGFDARTPDLSSDRQAVESEPARLPDLPPWYRAAAVALVAVGIVLRLRMYLFNRSLWFDEMLITLNIIRRPFSKLVPPLEYHQGAPYGFLA